MKRTIPVEAIIWTIALIGLALYTPGTSHFSLCPLSNLGFHSCPGCGLGRSISYFFHGQFACSWATHPFGVFAIVILSYRIISLTSLTLKKNGKSI
jgi:hypothetical protein